jgi:hypothetical protein
MDPKPSDLVLLRHRLDAVECMVHNLMEAIEGMKEVLEERIPKRKQDNDPAFLDRWRALQNAQAQISQSPQGFGPWGTPPPRYVPGDPVLGSSSGPKDGEGAMGKNLLKKMFG